MTSTPQQIGPFERIVLLKGLAIGNEPPPGALADLAHQATERRYTAGTQIPVGSPWLCAYVVVEGRIGVYTGRQHRYFAGARDTFGLFEVLSGSDDNTSAHVEADAVVLEVRYETLMAVIEDHFALTLGLIQYLTRNLLADPLGLARLIIRQRLRLPAVPTPDALDLVDRITLLHASDVFSHAHLDSIAELAGEYEPFHAAERSRLWDEGEQSSWMLVILSGRVDGATNSGVTFSWNEGAVPGMIESLGAAPRWCNAVAATPISGLRLNADRLLDAIEDDFQMAKDLLAVLATRVRELPGTLPPEPDTQG